MQIRREQMVRQFTMHALLIATLAGVAGVVSFRIAHGFSRRLDALVAQIDDLIANTAGALLSLALNYRFLPIYEK